MLSQKKDFYFAFVDLQKSFGQFHRDVFWWGLKKLVVEEWFVD